MQPTHLLIALFVVIFGIPNLGNAQPQPRSVQDSTRFDRDYALEASMLGYFGPDGARNPTLRANKGDRVRIKITNAELMTHNIVLKKRGLESKVILEKGASTSLVFTAEQSDTYFCSVPGHEAAGMVGSFEVVEGLIFTATIEGQIPKKDGQALNLDFETGSLKDWTATGNAFANPLISEDPSPFHEKEMRIGFGGKYFLSSGGTTNAKLTGTLSSTAFPVTQPFAAFRVSGDALQDTRVELRLAETDAIIFSITGQGRATLQPVVVELQAYL